MFSIARRCRWWIPCSSRLLRGPWEHDASITSAAAKSFATLQSTSKISDKIVTVQNAEDADTILAVLMRYPNHPFACDTEVADINVRAEGPIGNGTVTCVSIYGGPEIDFGNGKGHTIWVENLDASQGILQKFKGWFEDDRYKKVWHNYGFDRHVMFNEGINCGGFAGDTMHMARIWDTSRDKAAGHGGKGGGGASGGTGSLVGNTITPKRNTPAVLGSRAATGAGATTASAPAPGGGSGQGYSLESLSAELIHDAAFSKISMKELFAIPRVKKDGTASKLSDIPDIRSLQSDKSTREAWIRYSAKDALATWWVRDALERRLRTMPWVVNGRTIGNMFQFYEQYVVDFAVVLTDMERNGIKIDTKVHLKQAEERAKDDLRRMHEVFWAWAEGHCDVRCVAKGVDVASLPAGRGTDARVVNPSSSGQIQQLLFGTYVNKKLVERTKVFDVEKSEEELQIERNAMLVLNPFSGKTIPELRGMCKQLGLGSGGNKTDLLGRLLQHDREQKAGGRQPQEQEQRQDAAHRGEYASLDHATLVGLCISRGLATVGEVGDLAARLQQSDRAAGITPRAAPGSSDRGPLPEAIQQEVAALQNVKVKPHRQVAITTIGLTPTDFTPLGAAQVTAAVLKKLSGSNLFGDEKDAVWGTAFHALGGGEKAKEACRAIGALAAAGQIETTISNFLLPLQALVDDKERIHCSLNLNTETGRLSARRPNLQNQPALEKDQYKIRDAFIAEEGNSLVVADYGQLELRLLAHITNCKSMIEAFERGGCFHSRTAMGMYPHVRKAVDSGEVLLEWDYKKGKPPVPLVKDVFASERRKAKTLNFSIAYGKTVHGLAQDWGISVEEAAETLKAWYSDRPEVLAWQEMTKRNARQQRFVRTMMGRYRMLPDAASRGPSGGHALRAAINTPIQGSAADVVMMAMIKLWNSKELKSLGWILLLQIHDEVILEGPIETQTEAMAEVVRCMQNPFDGIGLLPTTVKLEVDAKCAASWYKAK